MASRVSGACVVVMTLMLMVFCVGSVTAAKASSRPAGELTGQIVNAVTREALIGVSIQIEGTTRGTMTDVNGEFRLADLPVGEYRLRVSAIGYETQMITDVVVANVKPVNRTISLVPAVVQTEGMIVRPDYFPQTAEAQISSNSQSSEEIRRLPGGFEDVVRAVSILPGVAQAEPGRNDLVVRGGAPSENLFLVDNLEVPNINHFGTQGATGGPLSIVNLDFVSGTTFSTGGFGARYGDKLSSVLALELREGRRDRPGGKATISASQFGLNLEGPIARDGSYIVSARRSYLDLIFKAAGFSFVPEYWDFLMKADYRIDRKNRVSLLGIGAINQIRQFNDDDEDRFDNSRVLANEQNQVIAAASWQHLFKSGYATVTAGQTYVEYNYRQNDSLLNPVFLNDASEHESSLRGDLVIQLAPQTKVTGGIQGKAIRFSADVLVPRFTDSFGNEVELDEEIDTTAYKGSGYAQIAQTVGRMSLTAGGRIDYFSLIEDRVVLSPRLGASFRLADRTSLNASAGRYYQAPSYIWLAAYAENRRLEFVGANQYIVGIERIVRDDTRVTLEAYLKNYSDYPASTTRPYLVLANTGGGFGGKDEGFVSFGFDRLVSAAAGRTRGLELSVQKKLSEIPCYGTLSVSYSQSEFTALDGITRPGSYDQRWILNAGGGYLFNERWELGAKFRLASGSPYTPYNSDGTQSRELYNSRRLEANHSLDLRLDRRWFFSGWTMITYIDIQNVYNHAFHQVPRWNEREQTIDEDESIGLLPTIGISVEF